MLEEPITRDVVALLIMLCLVVSAPAADAGVEDVDPAWARLVMRDIETSEYEVTWQARINLPDIEAAWHAPESGTRISHLLHRFRNPGRAEDRGGTSWHWGLSLVGYGRGGTSWRLPESKLRAAGYRVDYERGAVEEWYVNSPRGLEQGFVLPVPPEDLAKGPAARAFTVTWPGTGRNLEGGDLVHLDLELVGDLSLR